MRHCDSTDKELCLLSSFPFSSMMCQLSVVESKSATFPSEKARHLLDDSVLESRSPRRGLALASSSAVTNGLSLGKRPRPARASGGRGPACARVRLSLCSARRPRSPAESAPCRSPQSQGGVTKRPGLVLLLLVALAWQAGGRGGQTHTGDPPSPGRRLVWAAAPGGATGPRQQGRAGDAA